MLALAARYISSLCYLVTQVAGPPFIVSDGGKIQLRVLSSLFRSCLAPSPEGGPPFTSLLMALRNPIGTVCGVLACVLIDDRAGKVITSSMLQAVKAGLAAMPEMACAKFNAQSASLDLRSCRRWMIWMLTSKMHSLCASHCSLRRRTNVQQLTCKIDLPFSFYYLSFSFVLLELKPFVLKGKVLGEKIMKKCQKV